MAMRTSVKNFALTDLGVLVLLGLVRLGGYVSGLSDEALDRVVRYKTTGGDPHENVLWHLLVHVVNHGTEHRSTVAGYLTEEGHSPGDLDMVYFARGLE